MLSKPDLAFERDPRRQQELRLRPCADQIYREVFGSDIEIQRFDREVILDRKFAIDVQLRLTSGMILLGQEKFLSAAYAKYNSLTVEYMQNSLKQGDWFKLASQFYFTGYEAVSGFNPWIIANWPALVLATHNGVVNWQDNANKDGRAQASFRYIDIDSLPPHCVIARSEYQRQKPYRDK